MFLFFFNIKIILEISSISKNKLWLFYVSMKFFDSNLKYFSKNNILKLLKELNIFYSTAHIKRLCIMMIHF